MKKKTPNRRRETGETRHRQHAASPAPATEAIVAALERLQTASLDELIAHFRLGRLSQQEALARQLVELSRHGRLETDRRGRYRLAQRSPTAEKSADPPSAGVAGVVTAHRDGYGFVATEDGGEDVFLPRGQMRGVLHGDRLRVRVTATDARGRREGQLMEVIERSARSVVGRLSVDGGISTVVPSNPRLPEVLIPPTERGHAKHGQIVVAELLGSPSDRARPSGRVIEILGDHLAPGMEIEAAIRAFDLPHQWPAAVTREAAVFGDRIDPRQLDGREDLRELPLVTIDGTDAKDFDDAVAARRRRGGWTLWVAIADVAAYVKPGSALDAEAIRRGNSVYFPERVLPMLPEALSNGLCSLNPEVDRLCMVCEMQVDRDGEVGRSRFYPAVMRSRARLIYEEVAAALEDPQHSRLARQRPQLIEALQTLDEAYRALFAARSRRGAIDFESTETKIVFGPGRKIERIEPVTRTRAHRLIEECMIAANVQAAKLVARHKIPAPYRIHEPPEPEKVALLRQFLAGRGLALGGGDQPRAADFAKTLAAAQQRPDAGLIQNMMLRSLMQARYSAENSGHFGLALSHYAHFTSPIRRYPDLLLHRGIKHLLTGGKPRQFEYSPQQMEALCEHSSVTERRADEAVRDVITWLKCEYMQDRVGDEFDGVVTGVAGFGVFVELEGLYVDGMIHISRLGGDYWEYDSQRQRLVGRSRGAVIGLGQRLRVRVVRVGLDERKIDLEPAAAVERAERGRVESSGSGKRGKRKR